MFSWRKRFGVLTLVGVVVVALMAVASPASADVEGPMSYEVTIWNLTGNQVFTPPVLAAHNRGTDVFSVGSPASFGVKEVAENGNVPALVAHLGDDRKVKDIAAAGGPLFPGTSVTLHINGTPGRVLSVVSMLICTNDGFTGVDSLRLSVRGSTTVYGMAYDAGTEINTEDLADIVPPCQALNGVADDMGAGGSGASDAALAEGGVIHMHAGIQGGVDDLTTADHGFSSPVVKIQVTRTG